MNEKDIEIVKEVLIENNKKLLTKKYYLENQEEGVDPMTGHCYVRTETAYHLYGKNNGFTPKVISNKKIEPNKELQWTHWFLQNKETNEILDISKSQFEEDELQWCYENARYNGFLTGDKPSKRTKFVIEKFNEKKEKNMKNENIKKEENKKIYKYGFYNNDKKNEINIPYSYGWDVIEENDKRYVIKTSKGRRSISKKTMTRRNGSTVYVLEVPEEHKKIIEQYKEIKKMEAKTQELRNNIGL